MARTFFYKLRITNLRIVNSESLSRKVSGHLKCNSLALKTVHFEVKKKLKL